MNRPVSLWLKITSQLLNFIIFCLFVTIGCQSTSPSDPQNQDDNHVIILTQSLESGVTGEAYTAVLAAEGGDGVYIWTIVSGDLPQGLELDQTTGALSGTPSVSGSFVFTVRLSDTSGETVEKIFTLVVGQNDDDNDDPEPQGCDCDPLSTTVGEVVSVSNVSQLASAIAAANSAGGNRTILVADGTYTLSSMLYITADHVMVRSASGIRDNVRLLGQGMAGGVSHIFLVAGSHVTLADMTLGEVHNHAIQVQGEQGANDLLVHNTRIINTNEQMIKGSYSTQSGQASENGVVRCSLFEYTENFGPQYYIGGIDVHKGLNWTVRDNTFKNIRSPEAGSLAEHAIHFWSNSQNPLIERNVIENCDRGIGLGLGSSGCSAGTIRNNTIYADNNGLNSDVGIGLETATNVHVYHNTVFFDHNYPNAMEYRFAASTGNVIINNLTNRAIQRRESAEATVRSNVTNAIGSWFVNRSQGDLHLASDIGTVTGMGEMIPSVTDDMDCETRPNSAPDIGADQR